MTDWPESEDFCGLRVRLVFTHSSLLVLLRFDGRGCTFDTLHFLPEDVLQHVVSISCSLQGDRDDFFNVLVVDSSLIKSLQDSPKDIHGLRRFSDGTIDHGRQKLLTLPISQIID